MWVHLRKIISPPKFPGDEEKTRVAGMLNIILLVLMLIAVVFVIFAGFFPIGTQFVYMGVVLVSVGIGALVIMRCGHVRLAAITLPFVLFILVSLITYLSGGFRGSIFGAFFVIVLTAGLLLGNQATLVFGLSSIAFAGWIAYADARGMLPPAQALSPVTFWVEFSVVMAGLIGLLILEVTNLRRAYERAKNKENELSFKLVESQQLAIWAQEASDIKSRLLARISHELRTPLGAIMGMAEMLQIDAGNSLTEQQKELLERIAMNSKYLESAFSELLEQSQIDKTLLKMQADSFSPDTILDRVIPDLRNLAKRKGLAFTVQISPDLPKKLWGVAATVEQVLIHLIRNAVKFTETGAIAVDLYPVDEKHWALRVADTGIGIPKEHRVSIFEPFNQVDESITRRYGGAGLGLSIVKRLVSALGGVVHVESELGQGSAFTVTLPYVEPVARSNSL